MFLGLHMRPPVVAPMTYYVYITITIDLSSSYVLVVSHILAPRLALALFSPLPLNIDINILSIYYYIVLSGLTYKEDASSCI